MLESLASSEPKPRRHLPMFVFAAAAVLYFLNQIEGLTSNWDTRMHGNDFKHLYSSGLALRQGLNPYDGEDLRRAAAEAGITRLNPFVYLPFTGIIMIPFTFLAPQTALVVWFFLSHLLFYGALAFLLATTQRKYWPWTAGFLLLLGALFFPLTRTLTAGQLNVLLLFLLSAGVYFVNGGRERAGGVFLGVATMVKVAPGFLILFLAWKRRWKALAASLVTVGVLLLFSVFVLGPGYGLRVHREAIGTFRQMSYGSSTWAQYGEKFHVARANISPSSVIYRLLLRDPGYASDPSTGFEGLVHAPGVAKVLSIMTALAWIGVLAWVTRNGAGGDFALEFSLAVMVMLLVPSLFWDHYLTLLMIPFCFLIVASLREMPRPTVVLWVAAAVFLSRPYAFFDGRLYSGWGTLRLAPHLLAVLIIGAILISEIRRTQEVPDRQA